MQPGQAGVPFYVGEARCGNCWGLVSTPLRPLSNLNEAA